MPIYDNSPDADLGFKATLSFVLAIAIFGFGTLVALSLDAPAGILFALTFALLLAILPFVAGWVERNPISDVSATMDMGAFSDEPQRRSDEVIANRPGPERNEPARYVPDDRRP